MAGQRRYQLAQASDHQPRAQRQGRQASQRPDRDCHRNVDTTDSDWPDAGVSRPELEQLGELLPGRYVAVRVRDTGAGMDQIVADRAFEPFFTTKNDDDGAGLGLSAVRTFIARSSGRAWLTSQPGLGTTVTMALLADQAIPADLLLVDVVMPGITSQAFLVRARKLRPGIRILFMSGYQRPADASAWPDPGFEVIAKPFARSTLLVRIQQALASAATRDQASPPPARRDRNRLRE